jgi:hypothetical protein
MSKYSKSSTTTGIARGGVVTPSYGPEGNPERYAAHRYTEHVRAVVTDVYSRLDEQTQSKALYCDAYTYGSHGVSLITGILVTYPYAGIHEATLRIPRKTQGTISTNTRGGGGDRSTIDPVYMDGDHILVGFLDGRESTPVLVAYLPHPSADVGVGADAVLGERVTPHVADASVSYDIHQGSYCGIDQSGSFVVDTTSANLGRSGDTTSEGGGGQEASGTEVASASASAGNTALAGNVTFNLKANSGVTFAFGEGEGASRMTIEPSTDGFTLMMNGQVSILAGNQTLQLVDEGAIEAETGLPIEGELARLLTEREIRLETTNTDPSVETVVNVQTKTVNLKATAGVTLGAGAKPASDVAAEPVVLGKKLDEYLTSTISLSTPFGPTGPSVAPKPLTASGALSKKVTTE